MAGYGIPEADIGRVIGIDAKTLRKHYREELDTGTIKATAKVAESLYRKAIGDGHQSVAAAIFWLKTRAHWSETMVHQHAVISAEPLSPEEWVRLHAGTTIDMRLPGWTMSIPKTIDPRFPASHRDEDDKRDDRRRAGSPHS